MEGTDAGALQRALDQLTAAKHKAAEALYRQQAQATGSSSGTGTGAGSASPGGAQPESGGAKGDVIDAEVVDEGKQ